jgi:diacylglycerol O-acyltransferase
MSAVRQLEKTDMLFVAGETTTVYQHTAGLVILDTSARPEFSFEYLKEKVIERISSVPQFRWKLHEVPFGLDLPYWVEDEHFRYENHFKRIAVPSPGDREALSEVVAHLYSRHLDRSKPLWEFWFIEGLEGGKCAILQKLHHCMMDGQGASKLGELLCDFEVDAEPRPVVSEIANAKAGEVPDPLQLYTKTAMKLARFPGAASREIIDIARPKVLEMLGMNKEELRPKAETPVTRFNGTVGSDRGFVFGSISLDDIKIVKNAFGASVNDVLLALVSSSLRRYLLERGELPELALRTGIPISLRSDEDEQISNRVTQAPVTLATNLDDPLARLQAIREDCEQAKEIARGGGKGFVEMIQVMPPLLVTAMMSATAPEQVTQMLGSNLIVSNVRGSDQPMYIAGARLETMYPMSIITSGMGINFTCVSYVDQVDIGVTVEPQLVPDPWGIIDSMTTSLEEYLVLAKNKSRSKKKPAKKAKAGSSVKTGVRKKAQAKKKPPAARKSRVKARSGKSA